MGRKKIERKRCTRCGMYKHIEEFDPLAYRGILRSWCKECVVEFNQKQQAKANINKKKSEIQKYMYFGDGSRLPLWVVRTIKEHGNCALGKKITFNLKKLESTVGFEINAKQDRDGWILERKY